MHKFMLINNDTTCNHLLQVMMIYCNRLVYMYTCSTTVTVQCNGVCSKKKAGSSDAGR